jgi:hypothetical protein
MRQKSLISSLIGPATVLASFSLALVGTTSSAFAQDTAGAETPAKPAKKPDAKTTKAARTAYGDGQKAFEAGDFAGAFEKFKEANELIPAPHAQYWIALSLDRQEKLDESIAAYEEFLNNPDAAKVGEEQVASAKARLDELKAKQPGKLSIMTEPSGATIMIDGAPVEGMTPLVNEQLPGMHKVSISLEGYEPQELEVEVKPGEQVQQKIELIERAPEPVAAPPPPPPEPAPVAPPPPPPERSIVPAVVTLGIAGAGLVTGSIFGAMALSAKSDFNDNPTAKSADDVERNALISDMSFGIAITLGVTGIVLLTSDEADDSTTASVDKSRFMVAPFVGKKSGGAAASYTF